VLARIAKAILRCGIVADHPADLPRDEHYASGRHNDTVGVSDWRSPAWWEKYRHGHAVQGVGKTASATIRDVRAVLQANFAEAVAIQVELVWDPVWTPNRMSEAARQLLG